MAPAIYLTLLLVLFTPGLVICCDRPTESEVATLLSEYFEPMTISLVLHATTCLTTSGTRDSYSQSSIAVMFVSNSEVAGCSAGTNCTGYLHLDCEGSWGHPIQNVFERDTNAPVRMEEPRTDCAICAHIGSLTPDYHELYDSTTHCFECEVPCGGMGFCSSLKECCSYYDNITCTDDCGDGRFANEGTNFVCTDCPQCLNNGVVVNNASSCSCDCSNTGYHGVRCEIDINECDANICPNGTLCTNTDGGYDCSCPEGYDGENCANNIDDCQDSSCVHGTCVDGINSYTCVCDDGYTGDNCESIIDHCSHRPCMNGGSCINSATGYTCECNSSWRGRNCENFVGGCVEFVSNDPNDSRCSRCMERYTLVDEECVMCDIKYCTQCLTENVCSECTSRLVPDGNACVEETSTITGGIDDPADDDNQPDTISTGIIIGIVVSIALALVLLGVVVVIAVVGSYCYNRRNNTMEDEEKQTDKGIFQSIDSINV